MRIFLYQSCTGTTCILLYTENIIKTPNTGSADVLFKIKNLLNVTSDQICEQRL